MGLRLLGPFHRHTERLSVLLVDVGVRRDEAVKREFCNAALLNGATRYGERTAACWLPKIFATAAVLTPVGEVKNERPQRERFEVPLLVGSTDIFQIRRVTGIGVRPWHRRGHPEIDQDCVFCSVDYRTVSRNEAVLGFLPVNVCRLRNDVFPVVVIVIVLVVVGGGRFSHAEGAYTGCT